jgi:hypothetical protein
VVPDLAQLSAAFEATQNQPHGRTCMHRSGGTRCIDCKAIDGSHTVATNIGVSNREYHLIGGACIRDACASTAMEAQLTLAPHAMWPRSNGNLCHLFV